MADTALLTYTHTVGNSKNLFCSSCKMSWLRPGQSIDTTVDGTTIVTDTNASKRVFTVTAIIDGSEVAGAQGWDAWLTGSITYSGAYPQVTLYLDGTNTLSAVEVAPKQGSIDYITHGKWQLELVLEEKDQ